MKTRIIRVDPENIDTEVLQKSAEVIREGGLVAFPTDTVYGLGADVFNQNAVMRIFEVKGRPKDKPIAVLVSSLDQLKLIVKGIPPVAYKLIDKFWPGPLTLVLPCKSNVPSIVTGGKGTIGVRIPNNKVALSLINLAGPLATTSANVSGSPSPKDASEARKELEEKVGLIIDGGETSFGRVSTVADVTGAKPKIVRQGVLTEPEIFLALE